MYDSAIIQPYLFFDGKCEEAIEFYKQALGAKVNLLMRYKEAPPEAQPNIAPGNKDKVMHASLQIGQATMLASDGHCQGKPKFEGNAISLILKTPAEVDKAFQALSEGGQVSMPAGETFFSKRFGMLTDKFGVMWMVLVHSN
ncbi:MAG TPA: VOC family protein [Verrucomicrobiae bacterium]|jgi:PhnB protein